MAKLEPTVERRTYNHIPLKRVSWGSIFCGVAVGITTFLALSMLAIAVGLFGMDSPNLIAVAITWIVVGALALFAGGWTSGRMCGLRRRHEGALHGLVTWAVASLALITLFGSLSFAVHEPARQERTLTAPPVGDQGAMDRQSAQKQVKEVQDRAREWLKDTELSDEAQTELHNQLNPRLSALVDAQARSRPNAERERERVIQMLTIGTGESRDDVTNEVDDWLRQVGTAGPTGEQADKREGRAEMGGILSRPRAAASWTFAFMFIAAAAAMLGGWVGSPRRAFARPRTGATTPAETVEAERIEAVERGEPTE